VGAREGVGLGVGVAVGLAVGVAVGLGVGLTVAGEVGWTVGVALGIGEPLWTVGDGLGRGGTTMLNASLEVGDPALPPPPEQLARSKPLARSASDAGNAFLTPRISSSL
jgi:hypothetical protein